jgi:hypothetical protein
MNEIKKTMQNMKEEFNKDLEILKKNQIDVLEMIIFNIHIKA